MVKRQRRQQRESDMNYVLGALLVIVVIQQSVIIGRIDEIIEMIMGEDDE